MIKLLSVMEASTVTGPAKNLFHFLKCACGADGGLPAVEASLVTFHRSRACPPLTTYRPHDPQPPNAFVEAAQQAGITVHVIGERFRFDTRVLRLLRQIVAEQQPDIIETHNLKAHFLLKWSRLYQQHRWVAFHHGYTSTDLKMLAYNQLNRWSLPTADRVVAVCQHFARDLCRQGVAACRVVVQHNSMDLGRQADEREIAALRQQLGIAPQERVLVAIGRLSREKGHLDLLRGLAHVRRHAPALAFKAVMVGDGPERPRLEAAVRELNLGAYVNFVGHSQNVLPYYGIADALVLPSHSEGSPLVLLEAMAAGVPVVATRVGGVPEMVTDGESALLAPPRDPASLGEAMIRILTDRLLAQELAARAYDAVCTRYTPAAYTESLLGLYRELLAGAKAKVMA